MANDIIDINVFETIETVAITVQPNLTTINVNSVTTGANLDYTASPTNGIVSSDTGTDATIPLADSTNAGLISPSEKTKLAGIATGAEVNVNADWNSTSGDSQILNKPSIPSIAGLATTTYVDTQDALKVDKNTSITGETKTKITYDSKGLVTSGADSTTADIADSLNKRYQTDNQQSFNDATSSIQTQINSKQNTLTNPITGTGTTNYVSKFTGSTSLGNSLIYDDGSNVGIGTTSPAWKLDVSGVGRFRDANAYEGAFIEGTNGVAYFGSLAADAISLYSGGVSRVYINSSGNVGIGTTSPVAISNYTTLDLRGTNGSLLYMGQAGATASLRLIGEGTDGYIDNINISGGLLFRTNAATERMRITLGGNVGIGTTTPSVKLEVVGNIKSSLSGYEFQIYPAFDTNVVGMGASSNHNLAIVTNAIERMRITSSGNLLLGQTSDFGYLLQVNGTSYFQGTALFNNTVTAAGTGNRSVVLTGGGAGRIDINGDGSVYATGILFNSQAGGTALSGIWNYGSGTSQQWLAIGGTAYNNSAMYVLPSGNVGIGTTSPFTILELKSNDPVQRFSVNGGATNNKTYEIRGIGASGFEGLQFRAVNDANTVYDSLMFLARNGNVGIGTSSPAQKLDVSGVAKANSFLFNASSGGGNWQIGSDGSIDSGKGMYIYNSLGDYRISIKENGNVGIGTTSPNEKLVISGSGAQRLDIIDTSGATARIATTSGINYIGTTTSHPVALITGDAERMRIDSSGNVGIGTSSPTSKLSITDGATMYASQEGTLLDIKRNTSNGNNTTSRSGIRLANNSNAFQIWYGGTTDRLRFVDGGDNEVMSMVNGGNVGIGTSSPASLLHLSSNSSPFIRLQTTNGSGKTWGIGVDNAFGNGINFSEIGVADARLFIANGGNVGIGTTSPSAKLNVSGDLHLGDYGSAASRALDFRTSNSVFTITTDGTSAALGTTLTYSWASGGGGPLKFNNAGGEVMRLSAGGNVGIGTANPSYKLDVVGKIFSSTEIQASSAVMNTSGGYASFGSNSGATPIRIGRDTTSNDIIINASGNVGIGTTSPNSLLQVGSSNFVISDRTSAVYGPESQTIFTVGRSGVDYPQLLNFGVNQAGLYSSISARQFTVATENNLVLQPNGGNVGIGTSSPSSLLEIAGSAPVLTMNRTSGSFTNTIDFKTAGSSVASIISNAGNGEQRYSVGPSVGWGGFQTFYTDTLERMRITNIGNVGIGTTSPSSKLNVNGGYLTVSGTDTNQIFLEGIRTGTSTTLRLYDNGSTAYYDSYATMSFRANQNGGSGGNITFTGGSVGIGTTSPTYTLHVNGSVAGTSAYVNLSDERYKKDILPIENALDKVLSLNGVTFNWDKEFNVETNLDDANHIGLVAQQVEKIIPQIVTTAEDENQTKSVAYTDLIPVLIEAIKEQQKQIDELKKLINK